MQNGYKHNLQTFANSNYVSNDPPLNRAVFFCFSVGCLHEKIAQNQQQTNSAQFCNATDDEMQAKKKIKTRSFPRLFSYSRFVRFSFGTRLDDVREHHQVYMNFRHAVANSTRSENLRMNFCIMSTPHNQQNFMTIRNGYVLFQCSYISN